MTSKKTPSIQNKAALHPCNKHKGSYDFEVLIKTYPPLSEFVALNQFNNISIDFSNSEAVKALNKALLKHFYSIENWDIPKNYLCPPIPGRADYIHYIADLLGEENEGKIPTGIKGLDIGTGANCIYPIIGHQEYGWKFVASDIDAIALKVAKQTIEGNTSLTNSIECRMQTDPEYIFKGIIKPKEYFHFTMCNPPFHGSAEEAAQGTQRKWRNLKIKKTASDLNFGGQNAELWTPGGEEAFIKKMIFESINFSTQCLWFTSLVAKSEHLPAIYRALKKADVSEVRTVDMWQGHKRSRFVAWRFDI